MKSILQRSYAVFFALACLLLQVSAYAGPSQQQFNLFQSAPVQGVMLKQSVSFNAAAVGAATLPSWLTGARASTSYLETSQSTITTLTSGTLGIGQPADPTSDSTMRGLRLMRGMVNGYTQPNTFPGSSWMIDAGIIVTPGSTGPDGGSTATHFAVPLTTQGYQNFSVPTGSTYQFGLWAQQNTLTGYQGRWDGATLQYLTSTVSSSWAMLNLTTEFEVTSTNVFASALYGYGSTGVQNFNGAFPWAEASPYRTTYDPGTRASESLSATGIVFGGRVAIELDFVPVWGTSQLAQAGDTNPYRYFWLKDASNFCRLDSTYGQVLCEVGGVTAWFPLSVTWAAFNHVTMHLEAGNGYGVGWYTVNGGAQTTLGIAGVIASSISPGTVYLGTDSTPANTLDAYIQAIRVYSGTRGNAPGGGIPNTFSPQFVFDTASSTIVQDGSHNVSSIADARGASYPIALTTSGATRPVLNSGASLDGRPALTFASASSSFLGAMHASAPLGNTPWSVFLISKVTDARTTIASGSNGMTLPQATIYVTSTAGFPSGTYSVFLPAPNDSFTCTGFTGGATPTLTGCSGGSNTLVTTWSAQVMPTQRSVFSMLGGTQPNFAPTVFPNAGILSSFVGTQNGAHEALAINFGDGYGYSFASGRFGYLLPNLLAIDTTAPHARLATYDGTSLRMWIDGTQLTQIDPSNSVYLPTSIASGEMSIGGQIYSSPTVETIDQLVYYGWFQYGHALSAGDVANLFRWVPTAFPSLATSPSRRLIVQGNSQDLGYPYEPLGGWDYIAVAATTNPWSIRDYSVDGQSIGYNAEGGSPPTFLYGTGTSLAPNQATSAMWSSLWDVSVMQSANVVTSGGGAEADLCAWSNFDSSANPNTMASTVYGFLQTAISQTHAVGGKFVTTTPFKNTGGSCSPPFSICGTNYEAARLAYIALITGAAGGMGGGDALVDGGSDSHFQTACDGTYFQANGHPTVPLGQTTYADLWVPVLNALAP